MEYFAGRWTYIENSTEQVEIEFDVRHLHPPSDYPLSKFKSTGLAKSKAADGDKKNIFMKIIS